MAHLIFTKVVTLTLTFIRFTKKRLPKIMTIGPTVCPVHHSKTDKQTNLQTNRGDQYTFRKSKISKSKKWSDITQTLHLYAVRYDCNYLYDSVICCLFLLRDLPYNMNSMCTIMYQPVGKLFRWISKAGTLCYIVYVAPHELSARSNLSFDQPTISKS